MKKSRAFLSLFIILILPLLVYVALKLTSKSHYRPIETISEKIPNPSGGSDSVFMPLPEFSLACHHGTTLTLDSLKGHIWVVNLFYTRCDEACDMVFTNLHKLQKDYASGELVRFVSISIDSENDSLQALQAYAAKEAPEAANWHFVSLKSPGREEFLTKALQYSNVPSDAVAAGLMPETGLRLLDWGSFLRGEHYDGSNEDQVVRLSQHLHLLVGEHQDLQAPTND